MWCVCITWYMWLHFGVVDKSGEMNVLDKCPARHSDSQKKRCSWDENKLPQKPYWSNSWQSVLLVHVTRADLVHLNKAKNTPLILFFLLLCLDAGVPVYLYEFVYQAEIHRNNRPSFVRADHADDVGFMFGGCFWNGQIKITGRFSVICYLHIWINFICFLTNIFIH